MGRPNLKRGPRGEALGGEIDEAPFGYGETSRAKRRHELGGLKRWLVVAESKNDDVFFFKKNRISVLHVDLIMYGDDMHGIRS